MVQRDHWSARQLFSDVTCPPGTLALKAAEEELARQAAHQRTYEQLLQTKPAREHRCKSLLEALGCEVIQAAASRNL
jgi:protein-disulfide isomerase